MTQKQTYVEELLRNMGQMRRIFESFIQDACHVPGATMMQYSALKYLTHHAHCSVGELGDFLHLSKSSTTQLVERLVKVQYVSRVEDTHDRRIVLITITQEGRAKLAQMKDLFVKKLNLSLTGIPDEDMTHLLRVQQAIINTLDSK